MKVHETPIVGAFLIEMFPFCDDRGVFVEAFVRHKLEHEGIRFDVHQVNIALNEKAGIVRGMHFQKDPWAQAKIVMAARGKIFDAIVDVRPESKSFGKTYSVTLFPQVNALFMPRGIAHGCQALEDGSELVYLVDNEYKPSHEGGISPVGVVDWPLPLVEVAPRDLKWPTLKEWVANGHA